jgi:hypothetical protein
MTQSNYCNNIKKILSCVNQNIQNSNAPEEDHAKYSFLINDISSNLCNKKRMEKYEKIISELLKTTENNLLRFLLEIITISIMDATHSKKDSLVVNKLIIHCKYFKKCKLVSFSLYYYNTADKFICRSCHDIEQLKNIKTTTEIICPICFENTTDNITLKCNHIICKSCFNQTYLRNYKTRYEYEYYNNLRKCPLCRL